MSQPPKMRPLGEELLVRVNTETAEQAYRRRKREEQLRIVKYVRHHNKHVRPAPEK